MSNIKFIKQNELNSFQNIFYNFNDFEFCKDYFNDISNQLGFCIKTKSGLFILNLKDDLLIYECNPLEGLFYFLENFIKISHIDYNSVYYIIRFSENILKLEKIDINRVFHKLNWPVSNKGFEIYNTYSSFSDSLKTLIQTKKIGLNEAFYFHLSFTKNYDHILDKLKYSYSDNNKILKLITDIHNKFQNESYFNDNLSIDYLESIYFSNFTKIKNKLENFIEKLHLKKDSQINYNKYFETDYYELTLRFKNIKELTKKINNINKNIEKCLNQKDFIDLFDHKNLFK